MFLVPKDIESTDHPALVDGTLQRSWTYSELRSAVQQLAEAIQAPEKKLIFHFGHNNGRSVISYLAGIEVGHAVMLLDSGMRPEFTADLFSRYRPDILLSDDSLAPETLDKRLETEYTAASLIGETRIRRRIRKEEAPLHNDLSLLLSTSGTTGSPKFVRLSRKNVESNANSIRRALSIDADERAISSLPMFYSYGLSVINSHLAAGASIVLTSETILERTFWDFFRSSRCTSFAGVPYAYEMLARIGFAEFELPTLTTLTQAGGKMRDDMILRFQRFISDRGGQFFVMYGQTEATARITCLPPNYLPSKIGSVGFAIPDGNIEIEPLVGPTALPNQAGEVIYTGPNVMLGYATQREDLSKGDELNGRLQTGDLGYLDEEELLYITGRTKRIAKLFGLRVNLDEVEQLISPYIPSAVIGAENRLVIFCEQGDEELFQKCRRELSGRLKLNYQAFEFRRIASLPLKTNGKVDYTTLVQGL